MNQTPPVCGVGARTASWITKAVMTAASAALFGLPTNASAQWTINYSVNELEAATAIGDVNVLPMLAAVERAKVKIERILQGSTGSVSITIDWGNEPPVPDEVASSAPSRYCIRLVSIARDKLMSKTAADDEPEAEINLYAALPTDTIPFYWDGPTLRSASFIGVTSALNKHVGFAAVIAGPDGTIRMRHPTALVTWQFTKGAPRLHEQVFEAVLIHETMHVLGFLCSGDDAALPTTLLTWDLLRVPDASVPVSAGNFTTIAREMRPGSEATLITRLGTANGSYPVARGARPGGDGSQSGHWRDSNRLTPHVVVGIMDPTTSRVYTDLAKNFYSRADVDALDLIGWNVDAPAVPIADASNTIDPINPVPGRVIAANQDATFEWQSGAAYEYTLNIYSSIDDALIRTYDGFFQADYTIPVAELPPPGTYTWEAVSDVGNGYRYTARQPFTVSVCGPSDFDNDGDPGTDFDILAFFTCIAGNCCPNCFGADFDGDGDTGTDFDIQAFFRVLGGGSC